MIIEQENGSKDCVLTMSGETRTLKNCDGLKLARTIYGIPGDKYTEKEMNELGLGLKREVI